MQDLPFTSPSMTSTGAFLVVVGAVCLAAVVAAGASRRALGASPEATRDGRLRVAVGLVLWLMLTAALPESGLLALAMPGMGLFLVGCNLAAIGLALSPEGSRWARGLPLWALVGFHGFRLPLEIVLHQWWREGTIPVQMTWSGQNLDVITGVVSIGAGLWLWRRQDRAVAWVATAVGLGLLLNVGRVALLSTPLPLPGSFGADPPLVVALHAPYAWIVSICVAGALAGHLITLRKLLGR